MQDEYTDDGRPVDDEYYHINDFGLESGKNLSHLRIAYRTWGKLDNAQSNALLVPHALTGNASVDSWWGALLGPGKALDTERYYIVGVNMLGSCYGSTSPLDDMPQPTSDNVPWATPRSGTSREAAGTRFAADFPRVTIRDNVRAQYALLRHLGIVRVHAVVGGSAGGMQALEWAIMYPQYVARAVLCACSATQTPWQIAISEAQRQSIFRDPLWDDGYYSLERAPNDGLSIARMNAMVWYRSPVAYEAKFGRATRTPLRRTATDAESFEVEGYLEHQGTKFVRRFDANCYVALTQTLDSHDVGRGRGSVDEVLASIRQRVTVVGVTSDMLYPLYLQRELADKIPLGTLRVVESDQGHDAFLLETSVVSAYVAEALDDSLELVHCAVPDPDGYDTPPRKRVPRALMPTPSVLGRWTASMRAAADDEALATTGALGAVAW